MKIILLGIFFFTIWFGISHLNKSVTNIERTQKQIPVIDKERLYPETTFVPETKVSFIPLETSKDILLSQGAHIFYVSDKRILITNWDRGDVFIFALNGRVISHFNQKGGLGYVRISYAVYDEKNKEVFILDKVSRKIVVFTEEGILKRSFRMPHNLTFKRIDNFDDNSLLAFHEYQMGPLEPEQKHPYMFISKKDGCIISKLDIFMDKANPRYLLSGNYCYQLGSKAEGNCKFGEDYFLANMSSDTIFHLTRNKTLTPLFVQSPTVFSEPPVVTGVVMKMDDFIIFSIRPNDLKKEKRRVENGKNTPAGGETRFLMYECETGRFFKCKKWKYIANEVDLPPNISVKLIQPYDIIDKLKLGVLQGQLKEVATKLKASDNPVVEITRIK